MTDLMPRPEKPEPERIDESPIIEIGQWYWVKDSENHEWEPGKKFKDEYEWLGCMVKIGSNFVEIESPHGNDVRVHMENFDKRLRLEPRPEVYVREKIWHYKGVVEHKLAEVKKIMARLGVSSRTSIEQKGQPGQSDPSSRALVALSGTPDVKKHKRALIKAKDKELPKLFEEIKEANRSLATWMSAEAIPMKAMAEGMQGCVEDVKDRIFTVSLYAGLTEDVVQFADGKPADISEKLHLMQRRLYMDEECLVGYRHGGLEFKQIKQFDRWIAEPENRDRILPYSRCMVAFQVRRDAKERSWDGSLASFFINVELGQLDKLTFLYIRNGEQLYRMDCDLEFGGMIFPDQREFDPSEPMMVKMYCDRVDKLISLREYEELVKDDEERERKAKEWERQNPPKEHWHNPHSHSGFRSESWQPFDKTSVYYDETLKEVQDQIKHYNRIVLIIQGLFDRSPILHPHPPVRTWTQEGFEAAIKLIYDGTNTINYGTPPDFEKYRKHCNESLDGKSVVIGQDDYWQEKEAERENARLERSFRPPSYRHTRHKPYGNPGPGEISHMTTWHARSRKGTFRWTRDRQRSTWDARFGDPIPTGIIVPESRLFNISAYKLGDYKAFFQDPRTRAQYLKWAPTLLVAEEFHAGNLEVGDSTHGDSLAAKTKKKEKKKRRKK